MFINSYSLQTSLVFSFQKHQMKIILFSQFIERVQLNEEDVQKNSEDHYTVKFTNRKILACFRFEYK